MERLPPEPSAAAEALLRAWGAWPPDVRGYCNDPAGGGRVHWSRLVELLRRDARAKGERCRAGA